MFPNDANFNPHLKIIYIVILAHGSLCVIGETYAFSGTNHRSRIHVVENVEIKQMELMFRYPKEGVQ